MLINCGMESIRGGLKNYMGEYSLDVGKKVGDSMLLNATMQDAFCRPKKVVYGGLMRFKFIHIINIHQWGSE